MSSALTFAMMLSVLVLSIRASTILTVLNKKEDGAVNGNVDSYGAINSNHQTIFRQVHENKTEGISTIAVGNNSANDGETSESSYSFLIPLVMILILPLSSIAAAVLFEKCTYWFRGWLREREIQRASRPMREHLLQSPECDEDGEPVPHGRLEFEL